MQGTRAAILVRHADAYATPLVSLLSYFTAEGPKLFPGRLSCADAMSDSFAIQGGRDVVGEIAVSGSKNASLALIAAALLASGRSALEDCPRISDITSLTQIMSYLGVESTRIASTLHIDVTNLQRHSIPAVLSTKLRASILLLGVLLARLGHAKIALPGGCKLGERSIEEHLKGLEALGAQIRVGEFIEASVPPPGLHGAVITLKTPTVLGTGNIMMAACLARGTTHIVNAAREPEVVDLARCLVGMGAEITGLGTSVLVIHGRDTLHPYKYKVMEDRIEGGTFLILGAMCGNPLTVHGCHAGHQKELLKLLRAVGAKIDVQGRSIVVWRATAPAAIEFQTGPYPSFPTDLQPQLMALLATAKGVSQITETVFDQRFNQVPSLRAMGASISLDGANAAVYGAGGLSGAIVTATDLRAGASLVLAAIAAPGLSIVHKVENIDRGYENLEHKLRAIGVSIRRLQANPTVKINSHSIVVNGAAVACPDKNNTEAR